MPCFDIDAILLALFNLNEGAFAYHVGYAAGVSAVDVAKEISLYDTLPTAEPKSWYDFVVNLLFAGVPRPERVDGADFLWSLFDKIMASHHPYITALHSENIRVIGESHNEHWRSYEFDRILAEGTDFDIRLYLVNIGSL